MSNRYFKKVWERWHKLSESKQRQYAELIENDTFEDEEDNRRNKLDSSAA